MKEYPVVNSHNHWDKLEEVILGIPYHLDYDTDISFRLFFYLNLRQYGIAKGLNIKPSNQIRDESLEDIKVLEKILKDEGVIIKRPTEMTEVMETKSPWWEAHMGHALMSRDLFIVVGNEIIETPPQLRSRYFERDLYNELFTEYFKQGAKWTAVPKSRLMDRNFDYSYAIENGLQMEPQKAPFYEIMFDGAQILRMGKDMFFNCSNENHRLGMMWMQRHLGDRYNIQEVNITDSHIDGMVLPLKPGVLLVNRLVKLEQLPEKLRNWKIIWYEPLEKTEAVSWYDDVKGSDIPLLASESIGMNVLSLDDKKVIVQDIQKPLIKALQENGFEPIPCRWRHGRILGGGFHCMTLDIRRQSKLESYFD